MVTARQPEWRSYPYPRCLYRQSRSRYRPTHAGPTQNWPPAWRVIMPVTVPTSDQLKEIANQVGLSLTEADVASSSHRSSARAAGRLLRGLPTGARHDPVEPL